MIRPKSTSPRRSPGSRCCTNRRYHPRDAADSLELPLAGPQGSAPTSGRPSGNAKAALPWFSNARVHTLRVRAEPTDAITANLLYFFFRLDEFPSQIVPRPPTRPRAALIRERNLAHEVDVAMAWQVCDPFSLSLVMGVLVLEPGGEECFADDEVWSHYMLALTVSF